MRQSRNKTKDQKIIRSDGNDLVATEDNSIKRKL